ncbi:aldose epimerase family protein [Lacticaseibacillus rhamnosus]|uniref:aldose epimerase family protein n=1 Tax=Lacticaseibacillus rhamnosus TaxID=47715 RepID=UPI001E36535C|nr:aldose epimerase family protein [Lacticaseibacillus rhamnosus]MCG6132654.1 galactose mutarotase [Lacticaseibacillus rhamnosus]
MDVSVEQYGQYQGQNLYELTLTNDQGMVVKLLNYGATLEKVLLPEADGLHNMVLSLPTREDYSKERNFLGGTVGRIVGRIRGHVWQHGDVKVDLPMNEGKNHIHGGDDGLDRQVYNFRTEQTATTASASFTFVDPAGHNGYPGNLKLQVTYTLTNANALQYRVDALSDEETLFNPTNHTYFALDQPATIDETVLTIPADAYKPLDAEHLPDQGWQPVAGTVLDFRNGQKLGDVIHTRADQITSERGINHPFLLKNGKALAAKLQTKNHTMTLVTTAPSVVVYTANHFDGTGVAHNIKQFDGVALECQYPPVSGSDLFAITLLPGEPFTLANTWTFE